VPASHGQSSHRAACACLLACLPAALPPAHRFHPPARRLPQALFKSTVQLVLLPTILGLLANEYFKKQVRTPTHLLACLPAGWAHVLPPVGTQSC
jgi:hypothetical protein